jgi:hypothetical protein
VNAFSECINAVLLLLVSGLAAPPSCSVYSAAAACEPRICVKESQSGRVTRKVFIGRMIS